MKRQQNKPGYNKRLLGPRPAVAKGAAGAAGGQKQKLPSYKNRMRSIQRLLNKVSRGCKHLLLRKQKLVRLRFQQHEYACMLLCSTLPRLQRCCSRQLGIQF